MKLSNATPEASGRAPRLAPEDDHCAACSVSVIVLSYNSQNTIRQCLDSLLEQDTSLTFEVVLVDSSQDETAAIVEREYPWVRLIHLPRRALPGEARNIGILNSSADVIAFL